MPREARSRCIPNQQLLCQVTSRYIFQKLDGDKTKFCKISLTKVTGSLNELSQNPQYGIHAHVNGADRRGLRKSLKYDGCRDALVLLARNSNGRTNPW